MPELPEVETLRRGLERHLVGCVIVDAQVASLKMLKGAISDPAHFAAAVRCNRIETVTRRGKHLIFGLETGYYLLFHLKMRGQILIVPQDAPVEKYLALTLRFDNNREMRFHDMWTWGEFRLLTENELALHPALAAMGPEPFSKELTPSLLRQILARRGKTSIKAALLDQAVLAGVGNIYADESLFRSRIRPLRPASSLTEDEAEQLLTEIRTVLTEATGDGGTMSDNYVDADGRAGRYVPRVYERGGQPCLNCGEALMKIKVTGRGTVYCPSCQN